MSDWILLLYLVLIFSTLYDVIEYRIPNYCILTGFLFGILVQVTTRGLSGVCEWLFGLLIPFLVLILLYLIRVIGAGDVKLFMVIGGFLGTGPFVFILFYSFLAGAVWSYVKMVKAHMLFQRLQVLATYLKTSYLQKAILPYPVAGVRDKKTVIPFSVAILIGTLLWNGMVLYQ